MSTRGPTTTTNQTKDVNQAFSPYLNDVLGTAQGLYRSGAGTNVWQGPYVAGMNPGLSGAIGQYGANGLTGDQSRIAGGVGDVASGANGITTGGAYAGLGNQALTQNQGSSNVMAGLAQGDPRLTGLIGRAGTQNAGANNVFGDVAAGDPRLTGMVGQAGGQNVGINNALTGLGLGAPSMNADVTGGLGGLAARAAGQNQGVAGASAGLGMRAAGMPTAAESYLTGMASQGGVNPYLQQMIEDNDARIGNRVASQMSGAGRYGSGGHTDVLARSLAAANAPILAGAYESDQNRRLAATGQIDSSRLGFNNQALAGLGQAANIRQGDTGLAANIGGNIANIRQGDVGLAGNLLNTAGGSQRADLGLGAGLVGQDTSQRLAGAGALANSNRADVGLGSSLLGQDYGQRLGAASSLAGSQRADLGLGLNAVGGLTGVQGQNIGNQLGAGGQAFGMYGAGADRGLGIGQFLQGRDQAALEGERQRFGEQNAMPWQNFGRYLSGVQGVTPAFQGTGTTNQTQTQDNPFTLQQGLGLGMAGLGFLVNPMGTAGGFGSSLLGNALGIPGLNQFGQGGRAFG